MRHVGFVTVLCVSSLVTFPLSTNLFRVRPCVVYGGGRVGDQIATLSKGCDLLIGTPGRLVDFINRPHVLTLKRLKYMVIDEADEMLQSDWEIELKTIMSGGG